MFDDYSRASGLDDMAMLHKFSAKLRTKYQALLHATEWNPSSPSSSNGTSFFPAQASQHRSRQPAPTNAGQPGFVPPRPQWQDWFRRQTCGCGETGHPTRYCKDQSIIDRWYKPKSVGPSRTTNKKVPRIQASKQQDFKRRIYQALVDCVEEDDKDLTIESRIHLILCSCHPLRKIRRLPLLLPWIISSHHLIQLPPACAFS